VTFVKISAIRAGFYVKFYATVKQYKKFRYREEHSSSVLLSCLVGVLYDISWEKIC